MKKKLTAIIVGAGHRAYVYAEYALHHPDELEIVGVADPSPGRRERTRRWFNLRPDQCYESADAVAALPRFADFVINGTMDQHHVPTSLPLLAAGYDLLLEKPFATSEEELWQLVAAARQHGRKVSICHVLRYTPFYTAIRREVLNGTIGEILNVQAVEHVSYHHMAVGFVRGKWSRRDFSQSTMLMAKSCHDLDLIAWMKSGVAPVRVSSFGGNFQFRPEKAPPGAGTRCLVDCPIEADCLYSARKHYLDHPDRWKWYVWDCLEHIENPTLADLEASLKADNRYGRCVWKCDNDVVDHQSVAIEFADGCTATLNMIGGSARPTRRLHLVGTTGEIQGCFEDSTFVIRHFDTRPGHEYTEKTVDLNVGGDMTGASGGHGGGDLRVTEDFLHVLRGEPPSISSTGLEDSISGHLMGFGADRSRESGTVVTLKTDR
ncbi:MAG: Gfo/Idh/MocA family oxidoreductase [Opitutaceae bacterium]|nr:Gfo/Idh/MocA family oxidoreductase [Opitutaceae bacterium]